MLAWCSSVVTRMRSPRLNREPNAWATRLTASVALRVKTMLSADGALRNRATRARALS